MFDVRCLMFDLQAAKRNHCQEITSSDVLKLVPWVLSFPIDQLITPCLIAAGPAPVSAVYGFVT
jgi:hypothetical protein